MKRNIFWVLTYLTVCFVMSCKTKENRDVEKTSVVISKLGKTSWLIGEWEGTTDGIAVTEIWKKASGNLLLGRSFSLKNSDTISSEHIELKLQDDTVFYIPKVKNQNQGQIVKFALTSYTDQTLIFENPMHDFPQKITYQLVNNDSLVAEISGINKGQMQSEKFPTHRKH